MPVIVNNPRYERLAQCLAAGMRQSEIARELDYTDKTISDVKDLPIISNRVHELLEQHAQKTLNTGAIATLEERKAILSKLARVKIADQDVKPGNIIEATHQLNKLDGSYPPERHEIAKRVIIAIEYSTPNSQHNALREGDNEQDLTLPTAQHEQNDDMPK